MKPIHEMSFEEAESAISSLDRYFCSCRDSQQGIGVKESIRFRLLSRRILELGKDFESSYFDWSVSSLLAWEHAEQKESLDRLYAEKKAVA